MDFTEKQIEKMAREYAEEQNSCYTNDYYGFIAGFEKCLQIINEETCKDYKGHIEIKHNCMEFRWEVKEDGNRYCTICGENKTNY